MLSQRYQHDGKTILKLNPLQLKMKEQISRKVEQNHYVFEQIHCCICNKDNFELLSAKDRYGLYMPVVICKECGLIQTNPRMNQESYNEFYKTEYRKLYLGTDVPKKNYFSKRYKRGKQIYQYMTKYLQKVPSDMFVLEVGCSSGATLKYFEEMGCEVCGVDLDEEYKKYGKKEHGLNLHFGTFADLKIHRPPDVVIYSHVLEHFLNPLDELKSVFKMLEKGFIFTLVPGVKRLAISHSMDFLRLLQNAHTYHFTLTTLTNLMKVGGFSMVCGDEKIWGIFKKSIKTSSVNYANDYEDVMTFLMQMERLQKFLPFKNQLKWLGKKLLKLYPRLERQI